MPKLTGPDMKSLREGLLLSAQALADRLKHAGLVPVGHVRTVQRWEEGARPVPDDIADYLLTQECQTERMAISFWNLIFFRGPAEGGTVAMIRYEEDAQMLDAQAPHDHRLHAAALQRLRSTLLKDTGPTLHLVRFDPEAYAAFRTAAGIGKPLPDSQDLRAQWAALESDRILEAADPREPQDRPAASHQPVQRVPHARKPTQ